MTTPTPTPTPTPSFDMMVRMAEGELSASSSMLERLHKSTPRITRGKDKENDSEREMLINEASRLNEVVIELIEENHRLSEIVKSSSTLSSIETSSVSMQRRQSTLSTHLSELMAAYQVIRADARAAVADSSEARLTGNDIKERCDSLELKLSELLQKKDYGNYVNVNVKSETYDDWHLRALSSETEVCVLKERLLEYEKRLEDQSTHLIRILGASRVLSSQVELVKDIVGKSDDKTEMALLEVEDVAKSVAVAVDYINKVIQLDKEAYSDSMQFSQLASQLKSSESRIRELELELQKLNMSSGMDTTCATRIHLLEAVIVDLRTRLRHSETAWVKSRESDGIAVDNAEDCSNNNSNSTHNSNNSSNNNIVSNNSLEAEALSITASVLQDLRQSLVEAQLDAHQTSDVLSTMSLEWTKESTKLVHVSETLEAVSTERDHLTSLSNMLSREVIELKEQLENALRNYDEHLHLYHNEKEKCNQLTMIHDDMLTEMAMLKKQFAENQGQVYAMFQCVDQLQMQYPWEYQQCLNYQMLSEDFNKFIKHIEFAVEDVLKSFENLLSNSIEQQKAFETLFHLTLSEAKQWQQKAISVQTHLDILNNHVYILGIHMIDDIVNNKQINSLMMAHGEAFNATRRSMSVIATTASLLTGQLDECRRTNEELHERMSNLQKELDSWQHRAESAMKAAKQSASNNIDSARRCAEAESRLELEEVDRQRALAWVEAYKEETVRLRKEVCTLGDAIRLARAGSEAIMESLTVVSSEKEEIEIKMKALLSYGSEAAMYRDLLAEIYNVVSDCVGFNHVYVGPDFSSVTGSQDQFITQEMISKLLDKFTAVRDRWYSDIAEIDNLREDIKKFKNTIANLTIDRESLTAQILTLTNLDKTLRAAAETSSLRNTMLNGEKTALSNSVKQLQEQLVTVQRELDSCRMELNGRKRDIEIEHARAEASTNSLISSTHRISELEGEIRQRDKELLEALRRVEGLTLEKERLQSLLVAGRDLEGIIEARDSAMEDLRRILQHKSLINGIDAMNGLNSTSTPSNVSRNIKMIQSTFQSISKNTMMSTLATSSSNSKIVQKAAGKERFLRSNLDEAKQEVDMLISMFGKGKKWDESSDEDKDEGNDIDSDSDDKSLSSNQNGESSTSFYNRQNTLAQLLFLDDDADDVDDEDLINALTKRPDKEFAKIVFNNDNIPESFRGRFAYDMESHVLDSLMENTTTFDANVIVHKEVPGASVGIIYLSLATPAAKEDAIRQVVAYSAVRHPNIASIMGWRLNSKQSFLVIQKPKGSELSSLLSPQTTVHLSPHLRMCLAIDVARALVYMHQSISPALPHGALTSHCILVDSVTATTTLTGLGRAVSLDVVMGTGNFGYDSASLGGSFGYVDPEFSACGIPLPAMDVYAFGVILLELLTGLPALKKPNVKDTLSLIGDPGPLDLASRILPVLNRGRPDEIVSVSDHRGGAWYPGTASALAAIALSCLIPTKDGQQTQRGGISKVAAELGLEELSYEQCRPPMDVILQNLIMVRSNMV